MERWAAPSLRVAAQIGKDLPRTYRFSENGHLILQSTRPDEHGTVTWEC
jgi:hypothetical protein